MKSIDIKKRPQIGYKPDPKTFQILQSISVEDFNRSLSGIVGIIVNQYLTSTNGKLLKSIKIVPEDQAA